MERRGGGAEVGMICLICNHNADNNHWKLCFECWRDLGQPINENALQTSLDMRPNLIVALIEAGRI